MSQQIDPQDKDIDDVSGVETTGHEWDGIKELNNPAPRWWLWIFFLTIVWSIGYCLVYPSWPTLSGKGERGGTVGQWEWTQYKQLKDSQADIIERRSAYLNRFRASSIAQIMKTSDLYEFATAGGKAAFKDNCATCHGLGGAGAIGYPSLNDDDWLWGGKIEDIYKTIKFGIRSDHPDSHSSQMPSFREIIPRKDLDELIKHVLALSSSASPSPKGAELYKAQCASCHGVDGEGDRAQGAPDLKDKIWLYSTGTKDALVRQIYNPKHGVMPAWEQRLDEDTIRQLAIYVYSLGGGEK